MPFERVILHIDANSAFLSWEAARRVRQGDKLDLRDIPSVVGGDETSRRGIVLAKSIPAKRFGITTGEPLMSARRKCPSLTVVPADFELYTGCSDNMVKILRDFSPLVERYSIDEAFLDYTGASSLFGSPVDAATTIKNRIKEELGFTVNVGVGPNKLLAKMAGDFLKPDRVHTIFYDEVETKMWPLKVGDLFMVGRRTAESLSEKGITTIGKLARMDPSLIAYYYKKPGLLLWSYANGIDPSPVSAGEGYVPKSYSNSETLPFDLYTAEQVRPALLKLCDKASSRMRKDGFCCLVLGLSVKNRLFSVSQKQCRLSFFTDVPDVLYQNVLSLFSALWDGSPVRQLGVSLSELLPKDATPLSLFESERVQKKGGAFTRRRQGTEKARRAFAHRRVPLPEHRPVHAVVFRIPQSAAAIRPFLTEPLD